MVPQEDRGSMVPATRLSWESIIQSAVWVIASITLLDTFAYVLSTANPVLRSDDWYFLDAFVRRAVDGTLSLADFFMKRQGADHAQPLAKLVLWFEWRYLDLDVAFESIVGLAAADVCALILRRFILANRNDDGRNALRQLAWVAVFAVLLSLNAAGVWTWPLVALGYVTLIPALLFVWATWHALQSSRYWLLACTTILLGVVSADGAIIVVLAVFAGLLLVLPKEPALHHRDIWKVLGVIAGGLILVRVGYAFAPVVGGPAGTPLREKLSLLFLQLGSGDWWKWIAGPLALSVAYNSPFQWISGGAWTAVQITIAVLLLGAHVAFWWRVFHGRHNLTTFAAVCLMMLSYAWLVGILVYRVSILGTDYLHQERYVQLYAFNLVALLLMSASPSGEAKGTRSRLAIWLPAAGCAVLIALQIPLALSAWHQRPHLLASYRNLAMKIEMLAGYPDHEAACPPMLPICEWSASARSRSLHLLRHQRLNVFSPRVQKWHPFLPRTNMPPTTSAPLEH